MHKNETIKPSEQLFLTSMNWTLFPIQTDRIQTYWSFSDGIFLDNQNLKQYKNQPNGWMFVCWDRWGLVWFSHIVSSI